MASESNNFLQKDGLDAGMAVIDTDMLQKWWEIELRNNWVC